tara:strand:- start:158 stop:784 length:627 start_codon:yes stop_codon:yes gene_type:complete
MHKLNILIYGSESFISTINELRPYLKFNLTSAKNDLSKMSSLNFDGIICSEDQIDKKHINDILVKEGLFKILAYSNLSSSSKLFDYSLKIPTSIKELNNIIESAAAKKKFIKNSSIKIKSYSLDKNQKKLIKDNNYIVLTEKEIQLLELLLNKNDPMTKNDILDQVWHYSSDADTHTVETHIYRLRKKINDKFSDEKFILNNKKGYYL